MTRNVDSENLLLALGLSRVTEGGLSVILIRINGYKDIALVRG